MRKKNIFFVVFLLSMANVWAQPVAEADAKTKAWSFFGRSDFAKSAEPGASAEQVLELAYVSGDVVPDFFVYNVKGNKGYIMVAGDERMAQPIPVYSLTGSFDGKNLHAAFRDMLTNYAEQVKRVRTNPAVAQEAAVKKRSVANGAMRSTTIVGPLLGSIAWNQYSPYNDLCPLQNGQRPVTGCAATAASMVMKYHAFPTTGQGSFGGINYANETYNWDLMLPQYGSTATDAQKNEVAKIMWHTGVAFGMIYGTDGSATVTRKVSQGMATYFKYSNKMRMAYRLSYEEGEWEAMIRREIDLLRPILYSGKGGGGGHIFICDGYDSEGRFHFNYGWGGAENAFVQVDDCLFPLINELIIGLYPNNKTVADADQAAPQIAMVSPLTSSNYSPALGEAFNMGVRVSNFNITNYSGNLGIFLCKPNGTIVGTAPLKIVNKTLSLSIPEKLSSSFAESDVEFPEVIIPVGTADGKYKLRLKSQDGTAWFDALCVQEDVTRDIEVEVKNGMATFSYLYHDKGNKLELVNPIDVNVAANRATVRFSVRNVDEFYECTNTNVYVMVAPNNSAIPTIARNVTVQQLTSGLTQNFEVRDVPLPIGANITSCRFYIAYNRVKNQPKWSFTVTPMGAFANNFKSYTIPKETEVLNSKVSFVGNNNPIPSTYKIYLGDGTPSTTAWTTDFMTTNATAFVENSKLVTNAIHIPDDNTVLEWQMFNMYSKKIDYKIYVSENGQAFENFVTPIYNRLEENETLGRLYLGEYAGKDVHLAFEAGKETLGSGLRYFKLLKIETPKDIAIQKLSVQGTALNGDKLPVSFTVKNNSAAEIKKVKASYTIGSTVVNQEFDTQIPFNSTQELTFDKLIDVNGVAGNITTVKVRVDMTGESSLLLGNNTAEAIYMVADFFPRKSVLFYKTTKMQCPGCMITFTAIDDYEHMYPESTAGVELWRDGSYKTNDFNSFVAYGSTPSFFLNEREYQSVEFAMNAASSTLQGMNPPADVWAEASFADEQSRELKVKIKAKFALPIVGNYKVGAIVIENNVKDRDRQISGADASLAGDKLVKNHIPIGVIGGAAGDLIIANPQATEYSFERTLTIPAELDFRYRKDNIQVIAVLYSSKGEVLNSSIDSYYLKLPQTAGLTYKAMAGYPEFKTVYDVKKVGSIYSSVTNGRATIVREGTYKFTIQKDASWAGKMPKLIVNKDAWYNRGKVEELTADESGVYTITKANMHYNITIEKMDAPVVVSDPFTVKFNDKPLKNNAVVDVDTYTMLGSDKVMKSYFEVTKNSGDHSFQTMSITKVDEELVTNASSALCWVTCEEPDVMTSLSNPLVVGVPEYPYGQLIINYDGPAVIGVSTIKYTFKTSNKADAPLTVKVRYNYKGEATDVDSTPLEGGFRVSTSFGTMLIHTDKAMKVNVYTIEGRLVRTVQLVKGTNFVSGLMQGVYLVNRSKVVL